MVCRCDTSKYDYVIASVFGECYSSAKEITSFVFGWLSIGSWLLALYPQIRILFLTKRSEALSSFFLFSWISGDTCNAVSCFMLQQLFTQKALGIFWLFSDAIMISQHLYYERHPGYGTQVFFRKIEVLFYIFIGGYILSNLLWAGVNGYNQLSLAEEVFPLCKEQPEISHTSFEYIFGNILAYITIPCYCLSRPGQLYKNYRRKSTEGLSTGMFFATFFGNFFELISMLSFSQSSSYMITKIPFIIAALIPASCDLAVLIEILYYGRFYKRT